MNKTAARAAIRAAIEAEYEFFRAHSKESREAANDSESRAEGRFDARAIEANYLADGQARQAQAAAEALAAFDALASREWAEGDAIAVGALVEVQLAREKAWFFLGPAGGGLEVKVGRTTVTVITPTAPLGRQLVGLRAGGKTAAPVVRVLSVR